MEIIGQDLPALCGKAEAYRTLDRAGLNTPPWMQMDLVDYPSHMGCGVLCDIGIKTGFTGFRIDKKVKASALGRYPHLIQKHPVTNGIAWGIRELLERDLPFGAEPKDYALIINSAFTAYDWHACVKVTSNPDHYGMTSHQEFPLEGEVSLSYDWEGEIQLSDGGFVGTAVLRKAMKHWPIQIPRLSRPRDTETILPSKYQRLIPTLRDMLLTSMVLERYVECSGVRYGHEFREEEIICWGLR